MNIYSNKFDIEELLLNKPIEDLSPEEKRFVLDLMSLDEFTDCSVILKDSIDLFNFEADTTMEPYNLKIDLNHRLKQKHKKGIYSIKSFKELINYKIPVYKAAIASIAIICIVYFLDYNFQHQSGIIFGNDSTANENIIFPMIDTLDSNSDDKDKGDSLVSKTDYGNSENSPNTFLNDSLFSVAVPTARYFMSNFIVSNKKDSSFS